MLDIHGRPIPVTDVIDIPERLAPPDFWARVPEAAVDQTTATTSLWSYPLLRRHFFSVDVSIPERVHAFHDGLPLVPATLGLPADPAQPVVVAGDIRHRPIVSMHPHTTGTYSRRYYPRRTNDWLNRDYLPARALTDDRRIRDRLDELLEFMAFSQYREDGSNEFVATYFPTKFDDLQAAGITREWAGGWDYLFDWEWLDSYGYRWQLHEPDHHVNSEMAAAMVRAYELTGSHRQLESAMSFVYNQVPRYGFHSGVWHGKRYYWTEYNPSGRENPHRDATDNIQALVAEAVAKVGLRTGDRRMLEYARGLLWHCVREWVTDGRWYYDSAENPLNSRKVISHDMAVLLPALAAVPYLLKGGVELDQEMTVLGDAYEFYLANYDDSPMAEIRDGQLTTLAGGTSYFTANRAGTDLVFVDGPRASDLRIDRLRPPHWTADPVMPGPATTDGVRTGLSIQPGDVLRFSQPNPAPGITPASIEFTDSTGTKRRVTAKVPGPNFATTVTADTYAETATRLLCPD